jgi:hypothetical protein
VFCDTSEEVNLNFKNRRAIWSIWKEALE